MRSAAPWSAPPRTVASVRPWRKSVLHCRPTLWIVWQFKLWKSTMARCGVTQKDAARQSSSCSIRQSEKFRSVLYTVYRCLSPAWDQCIFACVHKPSSRLHQAEEDAAIKKEVLPGSWSVQAELTWAVDPCIDLIEGVVKASRGP